MLINNDFTLVNNNVLYSVSHMIMSFAGFYRYMFHILNALAMFLDLNIVVANLFRGSVIACLFILKSFFIVIHDIIM